MQIETFCLGEFQTNCYLLSDAERSAAVLIDAGFGPEPIIRRIERSPLQLQAILLTHGHADHIAGIPQILRRWPETPVAIGAADAEMLTDPQLNLSAMFGVPLRLQPAQQLLKEGQQLIFGNIRLQVLETPGHSPGGICLLDEQRENAFVGDVLFAGSIGRTDFPNSDVRQMNLSLRRLVALGENTRVWPGHGPPTTIGREKLSNPFLADIGG